jgi:hypothetical protein
LQSREILELAIFRGLLVSSQYVPGFTIAAHGLMKCFNLIMNRQTHLNWNLGYELEQALNCFPVNKSVVQNLYFSNFRVVWWFIAKYLRISLILVQWTEVFAF